MARHCTLKTKKETQRIFLLVRKPWWSELRMLRKQVKDRGRRRSVYQKKHWKGEARLKTKANHPRLRSHPMRLCYTSRPTVNVNEKEGLWLVLEKREGKKRRTPLDTKKILRKPYCIPRGGALFAFFWTKPHAAFYVKRNHLPRPCTKAAMEDKKIGRRCLFLKGGGDFP